jgi:hypothetical protein
MYKKRKAYRRDLSAAKYVLNIYSEQVSNISESYTLEQRGVQILKEIIRGPISTKTGMCVDNIYSTLLINIKLNRNRENGSVLYHAQINTTKLRSEGNVLFYRRQNEANRQSDTKPQRLNALYEKPTV